MSIVVVVTMPSQSLPHAMRDIGQPVVGKSHDIPRFESTGSDHPVKAGKPARAGSRGSVQILEPNVRIPAEHPN